jgi:cation transport ATPase
MVHTYKISGMTCISCEEKITTKLQTINGVINVKVSKPEEKATITMNHHIAVEDLQQELGEKYTIMPIESCEITEQKAKTSFHWKDFAIWKRASFNTINCLIGCSLGDFGMIIFLQHFYPNTPMMTQMMLSIIAGLITSIGLETTILFYREKLDWKSAFKMAIGMSFLSMVAMEIAMNITDFMITGGKMALSNPNYWFAFIPAAIVGFLVPLPYNYFQLKKHNKACH